MSKQVAETIVQQMGGFGRLKCMVGADHFGTSGDNLSFKFKGSKVANYIKITLNGMDLYDVEFGKIWGTNYKIVKEIDGLYFDQLIPVFEDTTKLYLSL